MSKVLYCVIGCTRRGREGNKLPVTTEPPSLLCTHCEDRLHRWLQQIPDHYALLPSVVEHGSIEPNPGSKSTKAAVAPAPLRLEVLDLLDARLGRRWNGTVPAYRDRRGIVGTLQAHCDRLVEERRLDVGTVTVAGACALLDRHRLWLAEQPWVEHLYAEIKTVHRSLADAVGDYRRPSVGRCHVVPEDAENPCGGGLYASPYGGVRCGRCGTTWDAGHLRQLGLAQAKEQA